MTFFFIPTRVIHYILEGWNKKKTSKIELKKEKIQRNVMVIFKYLKDFKMYFLLGEVSGDR